MEEKGGKQSLQEEFAHEFQKIENPLFFVALGYLHNTEEAKDAVQDAALSAYLGFYKLRSMAYFKTWMTRIVINRCKDLLKKRKCFLTSERFALPRICLEKTNCTFLKGFCFHVLKIIYDVIFHI